MKFIKVFFHSISEWIRNGFCPDHFWGTLFIQSGVMAGYVHVIVYREGGAVHFGCDQVTLDKSFVDYVNGDTEEMNQVEPK